MLLADGEWSGEFREVDFPPLLGGFRSPAVTGMALLCHAKKIARILGPQRRIFLKAGEHQIVELLRDR